MAIQRPLLPILVTLYQTAQEHPLGAQARIFEEALNKEMANQGQEPVPKPTQNVAFRQAVLLGVLRSEGENRGRRYFSGVENPGQWDEEELAQRLQVLSGEEGEQIHASPKATSGQTKAKTKPKMVNSTPLPEHAHQYNILQNMVWGVADTLRDKSNLQVNGYRPITLVLLALKRNFDTLTQMQAAGGAVQQDITLNADMLDTGMMTGVEIANYINQNTEIFDPDIFAAADARHNKACVPLMQWKDLLAFPNTDKPLRDEPITLTLAANPAGKSWFTYTTRAGNQQALIEELVSLHAAALREAFGAIGLHAAMVPSDPNAPRLSSEVLGSLLDQLKDIDMSTQAIPGDVFSDVYMDLLGRFAESSGKKGGDFFTPLRLVKGAMRFMPLARIARDLAANPSKQIQVADPTAGAGTFLTAFYEDLNAASIAQNLGALDKRQLTFQAQELTSIQSGLLVFNFFFHGLARRLALIGETEKANGRSMAAAGTVSRITGNTITEYVSKIGREAGQIDYILANPPYGTADYGISYGKSPTAGDKRWHVGAPTRSEGEWAFVNTVTDLLAPKGKAVIVLPLGVLFRDGGKSFRQYLIEKNWIEGVVALPSNQFLTTSIPVCLLFINKDTEEDFVGNRRQHGVFFINASEDFTKVGKFNRWDQDKAVNTWWAREEIAGYSGFISVDKLRDARNDYKLAVNRYFAVTKEKQELNPVAMAAEVADLKIKLAARGNWLKDLLEQAILATMADDTNDASGEQS